MYVKALGIDADNHRASLDFNAQGPWVVGGAGGESLVEPWQDPRRSVEQKDARPSRINIAIAAAQALVRELGEVRLAYLADWCGRERRHGEASTTHLCGFFGQGATRRDRVLFLPNARAYACHAAAPVGWAVGC